MQCMQCCLKSATSCCSTEAWLSRLVTWCTHIHRHPCFPLAQLWSIQQDAWLEERRAANYERPACRESPGFVSRWCEGWWCAVGERDDLGWGVTKGDKIQEQRRVQFLREFILGPEQVHHAIEDLAHALVPDSHLLALDDGSAE